MSQIRVAVTGGRDYGRYDPTVPAKLKKKRSREFDYVWKYLDRFKQRNAHHELRFCVGDATGVDSVVRDWCIENGVRCKRFKANWKKFGKSAGPRRNRRMLDKFKPTMLLEFPGGSGTANCVAEARKREIIVYRQPGIMPDHAKREAKKKKLKKGKKNAALDKGSSHKRSRGGGAETAARKAAAVHVPKTRQHRKKLFQVRD